MCQAYEAERRAIIMGEQAARREGHAAQKRGEPLSANPHQEWDKYDREAWRWGWIAAAEGRPV